MNRPPDLRELPDLPDEIRQAALDGNLVLFIGAGVSMLLGLPSWEGLALMVLEDLRQKGLFNYSELEQLKNLDAKKLLTIAKFVAEQNNMELNLSKHLDSPKDNKSNIYTYLNKIGCVCVTTNYDELLEPQFNKSRDGSTTPASVIRVNHKKYFHAGHLNVPGTVIHLHGSKSREETMVFTTKHYLEHYDDDAVINFLGELFEKKMILFIGYRLEEAEILEHILRRGRVRETRNIRRFALMPFFQSQKPLYEKLYEYYKHSFGVKLLGFIRDHKDYIQLEEIIKAWSEQIEVREPSLVIDLDYIDEVLG